MGNIVVRDLDGEKQVSISINELINIKGAIFRVRSLCSHPAEIKLQPANAGQIAEYKKKGEVNKPTLQDPETVVDADTNVPAEYEDSEELEGSEALEDSEETEEEKGENN